MTTRPIVFFDIAIAGQPIGRIKMELFSDVRIIFKLTIRLHPEQQKTFANFVQGSTERMVCHWDTKRQVSTE
jgi:hypothetical protein